VPVVLELGEARIELGQLAVEVLQLRLPFVQGAPHLVGGARVLQAAALFDQFVAVVPQADERLVQARKLARFAGRFRLLGPAIEARFARALGTMTDSSLELLDDHVIVVGFSDLTALLLGIHARTGLVCFHGPNGYSSWREAQTASFRQVLFDGDRVTYANQRPTGDRDRLMQTEFRVQTIAPGTARGPLYGGNLTVLTSLVGTPYLPDLRGAILFVEEIGEAWYAKPDAGRWLVSPADADPVDPGDAWADDMVLAEGLARYQDAVVPDVTRPLHTWAGLRTFAPDKTLVIGPDPGAPGFWWLAGQGGYGFQTAPAAARHLAERIDGRTTTLGARASAALDPARLVAAATSG